MSVMKSGESAEAVAYALMQTIMEVEAKDDSRWYIGAPQRKPLDADSILSLYSRCLRVTQGQDDLSAYQPLLNEELPLDHLHS